MFQSMSQSIKCQPGQGSFVKKSTVPQTKNYIQDKLHPKSFQKTQQQQRTTCQFGNIPSAQHRVTLLTVGPEGIWLAEILGTLWELNWCFCFFFLCLNSCWVIGGRSPGFGICGTSSDKHVISYLTSNPERWNLWYQSWSFISRSIEWVFSPKITVCMN